MTPQLVPHCSEHGGDGSACREEHERRAVEDHKEEVRRVEQSNDIAGIVIEVHHKCFGEDVYVDLGLRYGIADALWNAGYRKVEE